MLITAVEPETEEPETAANAEPEATPEPETAALPSTPEPDQPTGTGDSPIAVEGDEDTQPRKRARIALNGGVDGS